MKKIIILPLFFLAIIGWGQAQFVVQNGTKTEVYSNINTAISNAVAGDTLYIPGGGFTISPTTIDKSLHWVGHGHYPDSTQATMQSRINSALSFTGNCDNSSFEGIFFTSNISFGSASNETENIEMKRCRIYGSLTLRNATTNNPSLNFHLSECVINGINANNGANCLIEKSLIHGYIDKFFQSNFLHNDINVDGSYSEVIRSCSACTFTNNIFGYEYGLPGTTSCTFSNNIFSGNLPYSPPGDSNGGSHNITNVGSTNIYSTLTGAINVFDYKNDYHLNNSSTGTDQDGNTGVSIIGAASDGTNAGIYGSATPYKTIPYYPHINTATITTEAVNDQLGVSVNVQAQSR